MSGAPVAFDAADSDRLRTVFRAHFPELAPQLNAWNELLTARDARGAALAQAFSVEAGTLGLPTDVYDGWAALKNEVLLAVTKRAREGTLDTPYAAQPSSIDYTDVQGAVNPPGGEIAISVFRSEVAHLPSEPRADVRQRADRIRDQIKVLFQAVDQSEAARDLGNAFRAIEETKPVLSESILGWRAVSVLRPAEACTTCQRNRGVTAGV